MTSGGIDDGAVDHRGDALPVLSKSATKMKMDKLLSTPLPSYDGSTPGSFVWTHTAWWIARRVRAAQFRTREATGRDTLPIDRGNLCCAWHTNGLIDPLAIALNHNRFFVLGGRHDLVTRPLLSWWTRRMAVQPVVRKAELLRGGCSEEEATQINGRSLLMLATGISEGFGCVLFPEGTSHSESSMLRFRTGPMRTVLAAGAIAKSRGNELPAVIPIGLHFRNRELFRTDEWVEYGTPLQLVDDDIPDELVEAVKDGKWSEPPADKVTALRDKLRLELVPMTPNTSDWSEYDALHLMGHVEARRSGQPLSSWREEVLAARALRDALQPAGMSLMNPEVPAIENPVLPPAKAAAQLLSDRGLDGRDLNAAGTDLRTFNPAKVIAPLIRLPIALLMLPICVYAFGGQVAMGRLLGDSTDEGLDARTSYHFLAAMFGSLMFWPLLTILAVWLAVSNVSSLTDLIGFDWLAVYGEGQIHEMLAIATLALSLLLIYWFSGRVWSKFWDDLVDFKRFLLRINTRGAQRQNIRGALKNLHGEMDKMSL
ncbi:1-acyl-sn-glycerol-3-phosphate acyltransferase [Candidatus Poseidoniales archaeon]|nr:1-acyl-sn-glycerol-3-phosphate acyltransferase [Candidatus Poseidoniales archaeon]MDB2322822.1 1-acyl-sn-glycerol-3-phosphate acyltransferase [Candidatus Poseidoniales archaeon]MDB2623705.1 1-acyl-sn-glycerol-3-phosphate acyltransferase [Candidatus Poseidoniales archaeon]